MTTRRLSLLAASLLSILVSVPGFADEYIDPSAPATTPTVVRGMHGCDEAHLATGIHVGNNLLLCNSAFTTTTGPSSRYVDLFTQITLGGLSMHACPAGYAIKGVHVGLNLLVCERASVNDAAVFADSGTVRGGMHACPTGTLMKGLHVGRNVLACVPTR
jgi:hypothetical protein